jgi:hypothetical protein
MIAISITIFFISGKIKLLHTISFSLEPGAPNLHQASFP